jgi:hypothetical protein
MNERFTSGLPGLDSILNGILPGDNVVLCVDDVEDYRAFVAPLCDAANKCGRPLVYFRFAEHPPLLSAEAGCQVYELDPSEGFESFTSTVHRVIRETGRGAYYVFDCLTTLAVCWHSDQMLGNFFMLTCPYLFDMETLTYFGLFRGQHSPQALVPIRKTTQLFLDVYSRGEELYIAPSKVQHRYSDTMNMLHAWRGNRFETVTASALISEILTSAKWSGLQSECSPGFWDRAFIEATGAHRHVQAGDAPVETEAPYFKRLAPMVISRDERILELVTRYFTLEDILKVRRRMIGTGLIGGKAVGMLLARAIVKNDPQNKEILEDHDSFFIGSDEFYTYLVRNGIWWERVRQRDTEDFYESATRARRLIITGSFRDETIKQLEEMLDYFGQSPFIVRSSSLLEDNFGNAFAGKYESVFCANRGPRTQRLDDLLAAIRTVYASAMSEKALRYRAQRDMLQKDEQMALLVMRVSGSLHGHNFYPPIAGVGFSFNPFVWDKNIDPEAGVLRLVFGLGTRAVDRSDDDYTRIVALNAPNRRPEHSLDQVRDYAQRRVDYLDLNANQLVSGHFLDMFNEAKDLPMDLLVTNAKGVDYRSKPTPILTFERLLDKTNFVRDMRRMLETLQLAYDHPVDIEFAANFIEDGQYRINLLQCRPLQVRGSETVDLPEISFEPEDRIIEAKSAIIGQSRLVKIDRFIYVVPEVYGNLPIRDRYAIAELIGQINMEDPDENRVTCLIGPGRWGTSSPELGVPVNFNNISHVSVLCEIAAMHESLTPDVSLGTHFLNELVEMNMLYLALFPGKENSYLNDDFLEGSRNRLIDLVPTAEKWQDTVRVIEANETLGEGENIMLVADAREQHVICYHNRD